MIKALKVLLGFKCRTVQTFDPPGTYDKIVFPHRSVPLRFRILVAAKILQNNVRVDSLEGLYAYQVLTDETARREMLRRRDNGL